MGSTNIYDAFSKNLNEELRKTSLALKGIGDESYTTFSRLAGETNDLYDDMRIKMEQYFSRLRELITLLQDAEQAQAQLVAKEGTMGQDEYGIQKGEIDTKIADFKEEISQLNRLLEQQMTDKNAPWSLPATKTSASAGDTDAAQVAKKEEENQQHLDTLLKQYQSHATRLASLVNSFEKEKELLEKAAQEARENNREAEAQRIEHALEKRTQAHTDALQRMEIEGQDFYQVLFGSLKEISQKELNAALKEAKKFIANLKKECKLSQEVEKAVGEVENQIKRVEGTDSNNAAKLEVHFKAASKALKDCADMCSYFHEGLGNALAVASEIAGAAGDVAGGIAVMGTNPVQGVGSIISGVTGLVGSFAKRNAENKKVLEQYRQSLTSTYVKEMEYNALLRERLRTQKQLGETSEAYFKRQGELLKDQQHASKSEYQQIMYKLGQEKYISGQKYTHGTWFRKAKVENQYDSLRGKSYEDMELLYTQGKMEGSAKELFERLRQLKEEGDNINEMLEQLQEQADQAWTGTTASAITDSIAQGFLDGNRSAEDFAGNFEEMMKKAMIQSIKMKHLEGPLNQWYADFAAKAENGGLTEGGIEELRAEYEKIINNTLGALEDMERITGMSLQKIEESTSSSNSLSGAYAKASQESIDLLAGQTGALRVNVEHIHNRMVDLYALQVQGWNDVLEIKQAVSQIEGHSRVTKEAVDRMSLHGIKINMN
ncbi:MAG: hypothetical protein LUG51_11530 [Tannerellaceae bacterium]|nr:hypothetical protein [Tannerellaceae bacterium]